MKYKNFNGRHGMLKPIYTLGYTKSMTDDTVGSTTHYADNDQQTLCGKKITERWYILTNRNDGIATCKKCTKELTK